MIFNSAGWIGGNYTEADIKLGILRSNAHLFEPDECTRLRKEIKDATLEEK